MFTQNVCICNGNVKQKPPQTFIALATLQSYTVVSSELIIKINSAHKSIIQLDGLRAGNRDSSVIFEPSFTEVAVAGLQLVDTTITVLLSCQSEMFSSLAFYIVV